MSLTAIQWDPLIRSLLTVNPPYKKAKNLVPSKVFFVMTYESWDIRISLIRPPPPPLIRTSISGPTEDVSSDIRKSSRF